MNLYRGFSTQEEIDRQYNFALTVPDVKDWADFYVEHSAAARSDLDCSLDVRYGPTTEETVDIFPARDPDSPLMVFIHGGYWFRLSSKEFSMVAIAVSDAPSKTAVATWMPLVTFCANDSIASSEAPSIKMPSTD